MYYNLSWAAVGKIFHQMSVLQSHWKHVKMIQHKEYLLLHIWELTSLLWSSLDLFGSIWKVLERSEDAEDQCLAISTRFFLAMERLCKSITVTWWWCKNYHRASNPQISIVWYIYNPLVVYFEKNSGFFFSYCRFNKVPNLRNLTEIILIIEAILFRIKIKRWASKLLQLLG